MKPKESLMLQNLDHDLHTTAADIAALNHSRNVYKLELQFRLNFFAGFPDAPIHYLRNRKGPTGDKPFERI